MVDNIALIHDILHDIKLTCEYMARLACKAWKTEHHVSSSLPYRTATLFIIASRAENAFNDGKYIKTYAYLKELSEQLDIIAQDLEDISPLENDFLEKELNACFDNVSEKISKAIEMVKTLIADSLITLFT